MNIITLAMTRSSINISGHDWIRVKTNKHLKGCHEHKLPGMIPIDDVCIEKGFEIMTMSVGNQ